MNKVVLIGRLTKDPDLRFTPGQGKAVTRITVAVDRSYEAKDGIRKYVTEVIADEVQFLDWGKNQRSQKIILIYLMELPQRMMVRFLLGFGRCKYGIFIVKSYLH